MGGCYLLVACLSSPLWPVWTINIPGGGGVRLTPRYSKKYLKHYRTIPMSEYNLPIYQHLPPNHFEIPHHVRDLIWDSKQPSVTKTHNSYNTYRHQMLSVRTLRVRELCRHDRDTSPVNNLYRYLDAHIGSHIFYKDLYRSNRNVNIRYSLCHQYVTCPRFDHRYLHT